MAHGVINNRHDLLIGTGIVAAAAALATTIGGDFNTWIVPEITLALMGLLGLVMTGQAAYRTYAGRSAARDVGGAEGEARMKWAFSVHGIGSMIAIVVFLPLAQFIGFTLSLFSVVSSLLYFSGRTMRSAIAISLLTTIFVMTVFTYLVYLPLPLGEGIFRKISVFMLYLTWES